jgi:YfiH family protein
MSTQSLWLQARVLQLPGLAHVFTTRQGGISSGAFAELNLKYPVSEGDELGGDARVAENRRRVCEFLDLPFASHVACQQVHGKRVERVTAAEAGRGARSQTDGFAETDGLVTNEAGMALMAMVADCYPVLMADPVRRVAAAVHSGWRGTKLGILAEALQRMIQEDECRPEEIRLAIGPGIGFENFEIGADVIEAFRDQIDVADPALVRQIGEKFRLNLPEVLRRQALEQGLKAEHLEILPICTLSDSRFYSYRREGGITGRQAGWIGWR